MANSVNLEAAIEASNYAAGDIADINFVLDSLRSRSGEGASKKPAHHSEATTTQQYYGPDFSVAFNDAMPDFGYDAATTYGLGGSDSLWVRFSASEEHINKVRGLAIESHKHPLSRVAFTASFGCLRVWREADGTLTSDRYDRDKQPNDLVERILPKAFLLSYLLGLIRDIWTPPHHVMLYESLRQEGHTPLNFEQMAGLASMVAHDTLELNPAFHL